VIGGGDIKEDEDEQMGCDCNRFGDGRGCRVSVSSVKGRGWEDSSDEDGRDMR
jgi:hypothetical protein